MPVSTNNEGAFLPAGKKRQPLPKKKETNHYTFPTHRCAACSRFAELSIIVAMFARNKTNQEGNTPLLFFLQK
jgi:hypothetical protein